MPDTPVFRPDKGPASSPASRLFATGLGFPLWLAIPGYGGASSGTGTQPVTAAVETTGAPARQAADVTVVGLDRMIFRDTSLSASERLAYGSCQDPDLAMQGTRPAPSLRYRNFTPRFTLAADGTPNGGFNRDGRARTLAEQARRPFLAGHEMANADAAGVFDDPEAVFDRVVLALQQYRNANPAYFDLGRRDPCGAFKVPTLRNVATRRAFFLNGRFADLRDVAGYYVRHDANPEEWYPAGAAGVIQAFDDLPPALPAAETNDVVRFPAR